MYQILYQYVAPPTHIITRDRKLFPIPYVRSSLVLVPPTACHYPAHINMLQFIAQDIEDTGDIAWVKYIKVAIILSQTHLFAIICG